MTESLEPDCGGSPGRHPPRVVVSRSRYVVITPTGERGCLGLTGAELVRCVPPSTIGDGEGRLPGDALTL
jgi:hypothetical protein